MTRRNAIAARCTAPEVITAKERAADALRLRKEGATFAEIADALGYNSTQAAHGAVKRALDAIIREPAAEVLAVELERLDALWRGNYPKAQAGDHHAVSSCLRIMERRAKLLGLDMPDKVQAALSHTLLPASVDDFV